MEIKLYAWIQKTFEQAGRPLQRKLIIAKALELTNFPNIFKASKGWFEKFIIRYKCKLLVTPSPEANIKLEDSSGSSACH